MQTLKEATVLVVDDEPDLCDMLGFEFRMRGSHVFYAYSGEKALGILDENKVDAVITDIRMSNGNGVELLERIRTRDDRAPAVLFITAYDTVLSPQDAYNRGAEGIFAKPFRLKDLVTRVQHVLADPEWKWSVPPPEPASRAIERHFGSLSEAHATQSFELGRGGFAVAGVKDVLVPGEPVWFTIELDEGPLPSLVGQGAVRWLTLDSEQDRADCGVEFSYLADSSRSAMVGWLLSNTCRPFIPVLEG